MVMYRNTPQYHRAALSSCVGCLRAHPSPPGTDPQELKHMTERTAHITITTEVSPKYNQVPTRSRGVHSQR